MDRNMQKQRVHEPFSPYPTENHTAMSKALGIVPGERVLEVGGGHNPFFRADVLVDIDAGAGPHRDGSRLYRSKANQELVQGDVSHLPFKDKSFDVVICIQVLEHVDDPAAACEELMRVGHRGFLETPRKWTEFYAGHPTHQWLIDIEGETLVFEPICYDESPFLNFALPAVWQSSELAERARIHYPHIPCIQIAWREQFEYIVRGQPLGGEKDRRTRQAIRHYHMARNILRWGGPPDKGLHHARSAAAMLPSDASCGMLYGFYLGLEGKWREAFNQGIGWKLCMDAFVTRLFLGLSAFMGRWIKNVADRFEGNVLEETKK